MLARSPAQKGFRRIFTVGETPEKLAIPACFPSGIAKTRARLSLCTRPPHPDAQNPVTRLWTACTWLKSN